MVKKEGYIIGVYVQGENLSEAQAMILDNNHIFDGISYVTIDYKISKRKADK